MESSQALIQALKDYKGTVIFVSHDEDMISELANRLVIFDRGEITLKDQTYQEFLEGGGWAEEEDAGIFKFAKPVSDNKKQYLKRKEDKKRLRALQKREKELGKLLEELELQKEENAKLSHKAVEDKDYEEMAVLGKKAKEIGEQIDLALEELERVMDEQSRHQ